MLIWAAVPERGGRIKVAGATSGAPARQRVAGVPERAQVFASPGRPAAGLGGLSYVVATHWFVNEHADAFSWPAMEHAPVASLPTPGSGRLMDTKITRTFALVALLIYASGTGSGLCDLCPAPLLDGTVTIPGRATLQLKASTHGGDATLTGPLARNLRSVQRYVSVRRVSSTVSW